MRRYWASLVPFTPAAELIGRFRKVEVSEATVRRVSENSGQAWVELQREEAEALELEEAPEGPALQQLSVDGAMVPLLHGEWAEVKTLVIGTIEEPGLTGEVHAQDLSYFSRMLDQQSFGRLATVETHRRGTERAGTVCAVVDGAEWQQKFIDLHCPDAVRILDWCHAAEYLSKAGQAAFGAGTAEASEWLGIQLHQLKHGEPEEVLRSLRGLCLELAGGGEKGSEALQTVKRSMEYLKKRKGQIRYAEFQAQGYPIGSGGGWRAPTSSWWRSGSKAPGMHWARKNVDPMLALRTVVCSDRCGEVWPEICRRVRKKNVKGPASRAKGPGAPGGDGDFRGKDQLQGSKGWLNLYREAPPQPTTQDGGASYSRPQATTGQPPLAPHDHREKMPLPKTPPINPTPKFDAHPRVRGATRGLTQ